VTTHLCMQLVNGAVERVEGVNVPRNSAGNRTPLLTIPDTRPETWGLECVSCEPPALGIRHIDEISARANRTATL